MKEGESHDLTHEVVHRTLKVRNISDGHHALIELSKFTIGAQGRHDFNELSIWLVLLMTLHSLNFMGGHHKNVAIHGGL